MVIKVHQAYVNPMTISSFTYVKVNFFITQNKCLVVYLRPEVRQTSDITASCITVGTSCCGKISRGAVQDVTTVGCATSTPCLPACGLYCSAPWKCQGFRFLHHERWSQSLTKFLQWMWMFSTWSAPLLPINTCTTCVMRWWCTLLMPESVLRCQVQLCN